ncbi:MAG: ABC transporter ATP-binding protein [Alphaproteobacteria bacterium]|nr:ABC transporter ATP-binding protein [Alphaproteobacteria bacterium]
MSALLTIEDLAIEFVTRRGNVPAVRGVSLHVTPGESLGLVGESGSGKSVLAHTVMGLLRLPGRVRRGQVRWKGEALSIEGHAGNDGVRGRQMSIVFQDALAALNPLLTVGRQIEEVLEQHRNLSRSAARERATELLTLVGIPDPALRLRGYPHEFSGGMRQRAMIAMALAAEPQLLIADEPTTALDVTIQAQIIYLLRDLQARLGLAMLFITHDLGVIAAMCDRLAVIYAGRIVESGPASEVFARPAHPYTMGLLRSTPRLDTDRERLTSVDGSPPELLDLPVGCAFALRCPLADARCRAEDPRLNDVATGRTAACFRPFTPAWP